MVRFETANNNTDQLTIHNLHSCQARFAFHSQLIVHIFIWEKTYIIGSLVITKVARVNIKLKLNLVPKVLSSSFHVVHYKLA